MNLNVGKLLLIPLVIGLLLNFVGAKTDCEIFGNLSFTQNGENGFAIVNNARESNDIQEKIITKDGLNTALLNLKKYCCENEIGGLSQDSKTCKEDKAFFNNNSLDSPYLFDHIFDVMMRRLNGLSSDKDIYQTMNMGVDEKGKERREWINSRATDLSGSSPQQIIDQYKIYWSQSDPQKGYDITEKIYTTFGMSDSKFLQYVWGQGGTNESESVYNAIKDYDKWTLYDRYMNVCALSEYFYALMDVGLNSSDKTRVIEKLSNGSLCNRVINQQVEGEVQYVEWVQMEASNLYLSNYIEGYLGYLYNRGNKMRSLRRDSVDRFLDVVRAVPNLVNQCVK